MVHLQGPPRPRGQVTTAGARGGGLQWPHKQAPPAGEHRQQAPHGGARQVCLGLPVALSHAHIVQRGCST